MTEDQKSGKTKVNSEKKVQVEQEDIQLKVESLRKAENIAKEVKKYIKPKINIGAKALEIINITESKIIELGGHMAFPVNLCINNIAAHYTSPLKDDALSIEEGDVVKIDIGVHMEGYIVDTAFSINFRKTDKSVENIVQSTEVAVDAAKMMAKPQINTRDIGKKIETIIKGFKYRPIKELGGHQIERWTVHGKKSLPELGNQKGAIMEEGDVFAIEVFASTGEGSVHMTNNSFIYELNPYSGKVPLRRKASKQILGYVNKNYKTLPFAERWLTNEFRMGVVFGIEELVNTNKLKVHYVLAENKGVFIAQSEETILITKEGYEQLT
jgi:methionyl aminopeptidase